MKNGWDVTEWKTIAKQANEHNIRIIVTAADLESCLPGLAFSNGKKNMN